MCVIGDDSESVFVEALMNLFKMFHEGYKQDLTAQEFQNLNIDDVVVDFCNYIDENMKKFVDEEYKGVVA